MSFSLFSSHTVGLDMGSHSIRIVKDDTIILNERAALAEDRETGRMMIFGDKTFEHDHESLERYQPIDYTLADFHRSEVLVKQALLKGINEKYWLFPKSIISYAAIPINASQVEIRAYRDSLEHMNSKDIYLIYSPVAIAISLNILFEKKHFIIIDFSASKIEMTIFHNAKPIEKTYLRFGTQKLEAAIKNHIKRTYKVTPSDEQVLRILQNYRLGANEKTIQIQGATIPMQDIQEMLNSYFNIVDMLFLECIERLDATVRSKVYSNGIFFSGGGAHFGNICKRIAQPLSTGYSISSTPKLDVINGVKEVLRNTSKFSAQFFR